ncbi:hypothetical protein [Paenibacillus sp. ALJ109b]|uniref:hypothetical protein n=1 Tax=Paenibacillus sp. ALJ109b TaxID=2709068 RepID=UPI0013D4AD29|nr:hypothetical protein [Paenibacillus sp. ALJ109b]
MRGLIFMATVSGIFERHGGIGIHIDGLQYPTRDYSSFKTQITYRGVVRSVRNWSYYSSGNHAYFLDDSSTAWHNDDGNPVTVEAWGNINGTEFYIGSGNIF